VPAAASTSPTTWASYRARNHHWCTDLRPRASGVRSWWSHFPSHKAFPVRLRSVRTFAECSGHWPLLLAASNALCGGRKPSCSPVVFAACLHRDPPQRAPLRSPAWWVCMCAKLPLWQLRGISCHNGNLAFFFHVYLLANTSNPRPSPGQYKQLCKRKGGLIRPAYGRGPTSQALKWAHMGPHMRP
jgi:hypothetical protein